MKFKSFDLGEAGQLYIAYFADNAISESVITAQCDKERLLAMSSPARRREFVAVRALLQNVAEAEEIVYSAKGAPKFKSGSRQISISHSMTAVAIMISDYGCGVDIELHSRDYQRVAKKFITREDVAPTSQNQLAAAWATKEAIFKLFGGEIDIFQDSKIVEFQNNRVICMVLDREIISEIIHYREHIIAYCHNNKMHR